MDFLQTIWTALTTENEVLTTIITCPLYFVEAYILMSIFIALLNITTTKRSKVLYVVIVSVFSFISRTFVPAPYNTYINIVFMLFLIKVIFKTSIFKTIIALIVPFFIEIVVELIFSKVYFTVLKIDYLQGMNIPIHRFLGISFIYFIVYCVYCVIKFFKINFSKIQVLNRKDKFLLIANTIFGIILIATQLYILTFYTYTLPTFITLLSAISIFTYVAISFYTIFTVSKLETTSMSLEEAQLYNKTLEILQDNTRAFRHDFTNILIGMTGYIENNDMEGLKKYHSQLLEDIKQTNNLTTLSPKIVNNPAVYNVLASKYYKADNLGIKINLEVFIDLNDLKMKIYEFTRILGILMDNAIEATSECDEKVINVSIRKDSRKNMQILVIENTYKDRNIDTEKIYEKGFSTKEGNTGLGLWEIRQILKRNNNLNLFTSKNEKFFSQQFEIYC